MIGALVGVLLIVVVSGRATDSLRRAGAEDMLSRLPRREAVDYYRVIRRRIRRIAVMRLLSIAALIWIFVVLRERLAHRDVDTDHGQRAARSSEHRGAGANVRMSIVATAATSRADLTG